MKGYLDVFTKAEERQMEDYIYSMAIQKMREGHSYENVIVAFYKIFQIAMFEAETYISMNKEDVKW